ncbi:discoidin domain-containing protein [Streptomyces sp. NPDC007205]|uniref:discoidin domain-containing protein n=1 Tax=Streptomyces sp. NPDC007205 TaxID=3154316 RepID=UPI0033D45E80
MKLKNSRFSFAALWAAVACLAATPATATGGLTYLGKTSDVFTVQDVGQWVSDPRDTFFVPFYGNPVISGTNLYAPDPVRSEGIWNVYFGGWLTQDTNDEIYLATTGDDTLVGGYSGIKTVIGHGIYQHVNDPSAIRRRTGWVMAMTTVRTVGDDQCSVLTSPDGVRWPQLTDRSHEVTFSGAHVSHCGRPSLIWNAGYHHGTGRWEMYFDGAVNGGPRQQHLAVSTEAVPTHLTYIGPVGAFVDADIKFVGGQYIAAYRRVDGPRDRRIDYATSPDGVHFTDHGELLAPDPLAGYDDCGVTSPGWAIDDRELITSLMYGGSASCGYDTHQLGVAFPQSAVTFFTGDITHLDREAVSATVQRVDTHGYSTVDRVWDVAKPGAAPGIDQPIAGTRGDAWSIQRRAFTPLPCQGATASSTAGSEFVASKAIDGNPPSTWSSAGGPANRTEWISVDLGVTQPIRRVVLTPREHGWGFPIDFTVQSSDDGRKFNDVPFQLHAGFTNPGSTDVALAFAAPVQARFIRILASRLGTDPYGNPHFELAELSPQK